MRKYSVLLALLLCILPAGCNNTPSGGPTPDDAEVSPLETDAPPEETSPYFPADPTPLDPPAIPSPAFPEASDGPDLPAVTVDWEANDLTVAQTVYQKTFKSGNRETLAAYGCFPQTGLAEIDGYYGRCRDDFERLCGSLAEEAAGDRLSYQCDADFTVECNEGGLLSVTRTVYRYTGGQHGSTDILCETFSVAPDAPGTPLTLDDFFTVGRDVYTARLMESIKRAIDAEPGKFYEDAEAVAAALFPYDTFCVTANGLSLFFPEYNIAPYVAGFIRIDVPWNAIADIQGLPGP